MIEQKGRVKRFGNRGFGFIEGLDDGESYFFRDDPSIWHIDEQPEVGQEVYFEGVAPGADSRHPDNGRATRVLPADEAPAQKTRGDSSASDGQKGSNLRHMLHITMGLQAVLWMAITAAVMGDVDTISVIIALCGIILSIGVPLHAVDWSK